MKKVPAHTAQILAAAERERKKMAERLHDNLCQDLVGVALLSHTLLRRVEAGKKIEAADLLKLTGYVDVAIADARLPSLDQSILNGSTDLATALEKLRVWVSRTNRCRLLWDQVKVGLTPRKSYGLYRVAQESLDNAVRHSDGGAVEINGNQVGENLRLEIRDDGCGFVQGSTPADKCGGLEMMQLYAHDLGGTVGVDSITGRGTSVVCLVPASISVA